MKKILFLTILLLITLSISSKINTKQNPKSISKTKSEIKLDCTKFYKGKFIETNQNGEKSLVIRDGIYSFFYQGEDSDYTIKSKLEIIDNCTYKLIRLEFKDASISKESIERFLNFHPIEKIHKIEGNKAFFKGVNCDCEGTYEKIE